MKKNYFHLVMGVAGKIRRSSFLYFIGLAFFMAICMLIGLWIHDKIY